MQGVLACIDANGVSDCSGCLMGDGDVLLVLLSPQSSSERFGAGARPIHPIRVGSLRRTDSVAIEGIADIRRSLAARRSDANDVVDGAHSAASMCHRVVASKRNYIEGSRPWARLARSESILRNRCFRFTASMQMARW